MVCLICWHKCLHKHRKWIIPWKPSQMEGPVRRDAEDGQEPAGWGVCGVGGWVSGDDRFGENLNTGGSEAWKKRLFFAALLHVVYLCVQFTLGLLSEIISWPGTEEKKQCGAGLQLEILPVLKKISNSSAPSRGERRTQRESVHMGVQIKNRRPSSTSATLITIEVFQRMSFVQVL